RGRRVAQDSAEPKPAFERGLQSSGDAQRHLLLERPARSFRAVFIAAMPGVDDDGPPRAGWREIDEWRSLWRLRSRWRRRWGRRRWLRFGRLRLHINDDTRRAAIAPR